MSAENAVRAYRNLLTAAVFIVNGWPRLSDTPRNGRDDYPMELTVEGWKATLTWVDEDSHEGFSFTRSHSFPSEMLAWDADQLASWKVEEEARLERKDREDERRYAAERADAERETYERLKRKYG